MSVSVLIQLGLSDAYSQFDKLEMKNRRLKEENGKLAIILNKYLISSLNEKRKLEEES